VYGALESVAVVWRLRSYRDIIIIINSVKQFPLVSYIIMFSIIYMANIKDHQPSTVTLCCNITNIEVIGLVIYNKKPTNAEIFISLNKC